MRIVFLVEGIHSLRTLEHSIKVITMEVKSELTQIASFEGHVEKLGKVDWNKLTCVALREVRHIEIAREPGV